MSESNTTCPRCGRDPGGWHRDRCPRSKASIEALRAEGQRIGEPKVTYVAKGPVRVTKEMAKKSSERVGRRIRPGVYYNPGLPFARPPNPWYRGLGGPMSEELKAFARDVGLM